jgi:2,3-bisphosphoglycerate-independent phosphoglycerate mutase
MNKEEKKIIILLGDGMADWPIKSLHNKTPLEYASTPNMDYMATNGICGLAKTVPTGMDPGSDTANLSIFGYNPEVYFTGRAPLEAINMGIELGKNDAAFRCNIVNIVSGKMIDFTSRHIESEFSKIVIDEITAKLKINDIEFFPGVSYRNIMVWRNYPYDKISSSTPPHDITDKNIEKYLPQNKGSEILKKIMLESQSIIQNSEIIKNTSDKFKGIPTDIWLWGGGKKPALDTLTERYSLNGYTISAVDLIHGIGRAAGLKPWIVPGATGYIDTDYKGKVDALFNALESSNYIYLHVEAPDESGHEGNLEHKLQAIEDFDKKVVGPVLERIKKYDNYSILVMPDHPTPIEIRTHTSDPVPFAIYKNSLWTGDFINKTASSFNEKNAANTGLYIDKADKIIEIMLNN